MCVSMECRVLRRMRGGGAVNGTSLQIVNNTLLCNRDKKIEEKKGNRNTKCLKFLDKTKGSFELRR